MGEFELGGDQVERFDADEVQLRYPRRIRLFGRWRRHRMRGQHEDRGRPGHVGGLSA